MAHQLQNSTKKQKTIVDNLRRISIDAKFILHKTNEPLSEQQMVSDSLSLVFTWKCNPRLNDILPEGSFQAAKRRWQCRRWGLSLDILHKLHVGFGVGSRGGIWLLIQKEAIRVPEKKQLRLQQKKSISWRSFYLETIAIILPTQEGINFYTAIKVLQQISKGIQHTHALLDLSQNIWLRSLRTHSLRKGRNLL